MSKSNTYPTICRVHLCDLAARCAGGNPVPPPQHGCGRPTAAVNSLWQIRKRHRRSRSTSLSGRQTDRQTCRAHKGRPRAPQYLLPHIICWIFVPDMLAVVEYIVRLQTLIDSSPKSSFHGCSKPAWWDHQVLRLGYCLTDHVILTYSLSRSTVRVLFMW